MTEPALDSGKRKPKQPQQAGQRGGRERDPRDLPQDLRRRPPARAQADTGPDAGKEQQSALGARKAGDQKFHEWPPPIRAVPVEMGVTPAHQVL